MIHAMADGLPIGVRIARRRQALGMRQEDLARRVGVSRAAVSNWEAGKHFPKRKLGAVEDALGMRLDDEPEQPDPITERIREAFLNAGYPPERADYLTSVVRGVADGSLTVTRRGRGPGEDQGRAAG